jgi:hypothetical protein
MSPKGDTRLHDARWRPPCAAASAIEPADALMQTDRMTPDDAIATARRMLRNDLERTGAMSADAESVLDDALADRSSWVASWPAGAEHVPGLVAQDVQEVVHEQLDPMWPRCPEHGDHPLFVEPDLGPDPFWVCERTGLPVAPVGAL